MLFAQYKNFEDRILQNVKRNGIQHRYVIFDLRHLRNLFIFKNGVNLESHYYLLLDLHCKKFTATRSLLPQLYARFTLVIC